MIIPWFIYLFIILLFIVLIIKGCINNINNKGYIKKNNNITIINRFILDIKYKNIDVLAIV